MLSISLQISSPFNYTFTNKRISSAAVLSLKYKSIQRKNLSVETKPGRSNQVIEVIHFIRWWSVFLMKVSLRIRVGDQNLCRHMGLSCHSELMHYNKLRKNSEKKENSKEKIHRHINLKMNFQKYLQIFAFMLCVDSVTPKSLLRHKGIWPTTPCIDFLQCMFRHLSLRKFACKIRLCNESKPTNSCQNRKWAWRSLHCEIRCTQGSLGYVSNWSEWYLRANAQYLKYKSILY